MPKQTDAVRARLLRKIDVRGVEECWLWKAGKFKGFGHGAFYWNGQNMAASRAAYLLLVGPIPDGLFVCHRCDVPACCNPAHLFLGTPNDNMQDCVKKGRRQRGVDHYKARLTPSIVVEARRQYADAKRNGSTYGVFTRMVQEYGLPYQALKLAVYGHNWKEVGNGTTL